MQNIISGRFENRPPSKAWLSIFKKLSFPNLLSLQNPKEIVLHITSAFGVIAIAILVAMFFNPDLTNSFKQLSPFDNELGTEKSVEKNPTAAVTTNLNMLMAAPQLIADTPSQGIATNKPLEQQLIGTQNQQKLVTSWLSKRYRVASDAINMLVSASYLTAQETKLDPLLILSVIAIESRFNPFSESPVGAQGLMQVMSKVHYDKFSVHGGVKAALNPVANIQVGALILKDYVNRSGSIEGGLKRYVGATDMDSDGGYGALVLAEYKRLKEVAAGKRVSIYATTPKPVEIEKPQVTVPVATNETTSTDPITLTNKRSTEI